MKMLEFRQNVIESEMCMQIKQQTKRNETNEKLISTSYLNVVFFSNNRRKKKTTSKTKNRKTD